MLGIWALISASIVIYETAAPVIAIFGADVALKVSPAEREANQGKMKQSASGIMSTRARQRPRKAEEVMAIAEGSEMGFFRDSLEHSSQ